MGVSLNSVQGWESGKYKTKKARLADLAKHLGVDADELESVYNDDGEDFSNFPSFLYTDNQNEIIKTLRLTPEHKELVMLLKIYNSDTPDEGVGGWSSTVMSCLKRIPYKYVENKGVFKVYELGLHLSRFFRYVPVSFCFEMIRNYPDTVFDIRTLAKSEIIKWMKLGKFGEQYYIDRAISFRNFQESTEKLNKWEYRDRKKQLSQNDLCTSQPQVPFTEVVFDDENHTITNKLTQTGILFKEWCRDLELDPKQHV